MINADFCEQLGISNYELRTLICKTDTIYKLRITSYLPRSYLAAQGGARQGGRVKNYE